ncbi:MAG: glycosyltransferase [Prevotella sp.]|nr:glycosyltransferase [Prevotella sp.]
MKILIISHGIPSEEDPQWGCFELDQARALEKMGHQVTMAAVDTRMRKGRHRGIRHTRFGTIGAYLYYLLPTRLLFFSFLKIFVRTKMMASLFEKIVKEQGLPDVIYAHYMFNMASLVEVKRKYRQIPIVGIEHWSVLNQDRLTPCLMSRGRIAYSNVDRLLAVSKSLQSQIKRHFGIESTVVYDMLGQEFVHSKTIVRNAEKENFSFLAIGSLLHRKGFDLLLDAFSKSRLYETCRLTIIGDGQERTNLLSQAKRLGVANAVCLVGKKNKKEIIQLLNESHVFVLSSRSETFGVVCIEALSQGLPNIATICGGPEEFINESNGILVPANDADALAEAMTKMHDTYDSYDRTAIAKECLCKFSPSVIAKQLTSIFEDVAR